MHPKVYSIEYIRDGMNTPRRINMGTGSVGYCLAHSLADSVMRSNSQYAIIIRQGEYEVFKWVTEKYAPMYSDKN